MKTLVLVWRVTVRCKESVGLLLDWDDATHVVSHPVNICSNNNQCQEQPNSPERKVAVADCESKQMAYGTKLPATLVPCLPLHLAQHLARAQIVPNVSQNAVKLTEGLPSKRGLSSDPLQSLEGVERIVRNAVVNESIERKLSCRRPTLLIVHDRPGKGIC